MIVVDASVVANLVGDDGSAGSRARGAVVAADGVAVPDLVDAESVAVFRRRWLDGDLTLVTVPGAGHFVHHDKPEFINRTLKMWLLRDR